MVRVLGGALLLDRDAGQGRERARQRGPLVDHGGRHLGALQEGRPGLLGVPGHQAVEVVAGDGVAVVGEVRVLRPPHVDGAAEAEGPQPAVAVGAGQGPLQVHVGQLPDGPRREPVAAGLLPGELLLLHHHDVPAGVGQPVGARRAGGPGPDDHHVVDVLGRRPRRAAGARWRRWGFAAASRGGCRGACLGGLVALLAAPLRGGCRLLGGGLGRRRFLGRRLLLRRGLPGAFVGAPPSWGRRARGSRREPSPGHRRSPAGASDQRRGCAWRRGRMVETEHSGPVPPDPHPGRARPRFHRVLAGVLSDAGAAEEADRGQARALRVRHRARTWSRRSASRCASTWCR